MLNNVRVGCFVGTMLVNHLIYADDLVLLSPSAAGLSILLSICSLLSDSENEAEGLRSLFDSSEILFQIRRMTQRCTR